MINEKKKAMDIEELNKLLSYYVDVIDEEYIQIDVMFVKKTSNAKKLYKTWMLVCRNQDVTDMIKETIENMKIVCEKRKIDNYDLELSTDDTIQVIEEEKVLNYPQLINCLSVNYTDENVVSDETDYNEFGYSDFFDKDVLTNQGISTPKNQFCDTFVTLFRVKKGKSVTKIQKVSQKASQK